MARGVERVVIRNSSRPHNASSSMVGLASWRPYGRGDASRLALLGPSRVGPQAPKLPSISAATPSGCAMPFNARSTCLRCCRGHTSACKCRIVQCTSMCRAMAFCVRVCIACIVFCARWRVCLPRSSGRVLHTWMEGAVTSARRRGRVCDENAIRDPLLRSRAMGL